jgi:hypothetical protein
VTRSEHRTYKACPGIAAKIRRALLEGPATSAELKHTAGFRKIKRRTIQVGLYILTETDQVKVVGTVPHERTTGRAPLLYQLTAKGEKIARYGRIVTRRVLVANIPCRQCGELFCSAGIVSHQRSCVARAAIGRPSRRQELAAIPRDRPCPHCSRLFHRVGLPLHAAKCGRRRVAPST